MVIGKGITKVFKTTVLSGPIQFKCEIGLLKQLFQYFLTDLIWQKTNLIYKEMILMVILKIYYSSGVITYITNVQAMPVIFLTIYKIQTASEHLLVSLQLIARLFVTQKMKLHFQVVFLRGLRIKFHEVDLAGTNRITKWPHMFQI